MLNRKHLLIALLATNLLGQHTMAEAAKGKNNKTYNYYQKQNKKVTSLLNSARKQVSKGKMQNAINTYWKILEIDHAEPYAYLELGEIYKNLRIYDRSIEMLTTGLELAQEIDGDTLCHYYCVLVEAYSITNQQGLANQALIKAAETAPRNPMPRKVLGDIYLKNNRIANAFKAYKKSIELDPNYQPAIVALSELKSEYGDKLPKEDKDSEYIKKVAVKLDEEVQASKEDQVAQKKPSESVPPKAKKPVMKKEITILEERPIPLKKEEMAKIAKSSVFTPAKQEEFNAENDESDVNEIEDSDANKITANIESESENEIKELALNEESIESSIDENINKFLEGDYAEKEEAIEFFINSGKPGLDAIEELLFDRNPEVRILAVRALPKFKEYKNEVKAILNDAIEDSDENVALAVKEALDSI